MHQYLGSNVSNEYKRWFIIISGLKIYPEHHQFLFVLALKIVTFGTKTWHHCFLAFCAPAMFMANSQYYLILLLYLDRPFIFKLEAKYIAFQTLQKPQTSLKTSVLNKKIKWGPKCQIIWLGSVSSKSRIQASERLDQSSFRSFVLTL